MGKLPRWFSNVGYWHISAVQGCPRDGREGKADFSGSAEGPLLTLSGG
jgi:hypothetical protein